MDQNKFTSEQCLLSQLQITSVYKDSLKSLYIYKSMSDALAILAQENFTGRNVLQSASMSQVWLFTCHMPVIERERERERKRENLEEGMTGRNL